MTQLTPGAFYISCKNPRKLFMNVETSMADPIVKIAIARETAFCTSQYDIGAVMVRMYHCPRPEMSLHDTYQIGMLFVLNFVYNRYMGCPKKLTQKK